MHLTPSTGTGKTQVIWDCNTAVNVERVERREVSGDGLLRAAEVMFLFSVEGELMADIDLFQI
jgi:hypothetical protein